MSSHRLKVETGRRHKPEAIPYNDRKCTFCSKLEDEFYALLECTKRPNMPKFIELLS